MLRHKSREAWLHLAEKNSKFFHSVVKVKTAKNHISILISDTGIHISNLPTLREMAAEFYKNLFNHAGYWNVFPKLVAKKRLTPDVAAWLDRYEVLRRYTRLYQTCIQIKLQVLMCIMLYSLKKIGE